MSTCIIRNTHALKKLKVHLINAGGEDDAMRLKSSSNCKNANELLYAHPSHASCHKKCFLQPLHIVHNHDCANNGEERKRWEITRGMIVRFNEN